MKLLVPLFAALIFILQPINPATAVFVEERLADPALEKRAYDLSKEIRCLVCQNQSISDSNAGLARDLRQIVRERVAAGDSDDAVKQYLVDRYGDWVLMEPPFKTGTLLLWFGPALFLFGGGVIVLLMARRRNKPVPGGVQQLSEHEQQQLKTLLDPEDGEKS